jgi:hypothetical protein
MVHWCNTKTKPDIKLCPGIGSVEAAKLAEEDEHGSVMDAYDLLAKWLSGHKAGNEGSDYYDPKPANKKFYDFLAAKDVGVDDDHRRTIVQAVYQKLLTLLLPPPPPPPDDLGC